MATRLHTKKKFVDTNKGAVSKRLKGMRKAGGERLKEFDQKKAQNASNHGPVGTSQTEQVSTPPSEAMPPPVQATAISFTTAILAASSMTPAIEPSPRAVLWFCR